MTETKVISPEMAEVMERVERLERNFLQLLDVLALEHENVAKIARLIELQIRGHTER